MDQPAQATQDEPTRKTILKHAYDPATFDPVGFLATAQQMARQLVEDAELTQLDVWNVASDGRILWRFTPVHAEYRFRSPSRSLIEPTRDNLGQHPCRVIIGLEETGAIRQLTARRDDEGRCDEPLEPLPRCSLAQIWARASAAGIKDDRIAEITWLGAKWQLHVSTMFNADRTVALNASEQTLTFDDTCR